MQHVKNVVEMPKVTAHLMALPAIEVKGHTVDTLTRLVQEKMVDGLIQLHTDILGSKPEALSKD